MHIQPNVRYLLQLKKSAKADAKPVQFVISPESLQNVRERARIPRFKITGHLDSTVCCLTTPFTGEVSYLFTKADFDQLPICQDPILTYLFLKLVVQNSEIPIKSVELQLVRVETCGCAEGYSRDGKLFLITNNWCLFKFYHCLATEIQNVQIGEGDVACGIAIPIDMVFPRLFTCPTLTTSSFKIGMLPRKKNKNILIFIFHCCRV